jgi:hypothetical protein
MSTSMYDMGTPGTDQTEDANRKEALNRGGEEKDVDTSEASSSSSHHSSPTHHQRQTLTVSNGDGSASQPREVTPMDVSGTMATSGAWSEHDNGVDANGAALPASLQFSYNGHGPTSTSTTHTGLEDSR